MRLDAVGKRYGLRQPWVIRDVSLEVPPGRLVRVEGRNGSGKSTLLRVLAGVLSPSAGKVAGRPPAGFVPERFPPGLPFTAHDYLMHLGRLHGLRGRALAARIEECLGMLGAAADARLPMAVMSKGMCQKVAVAQALLARPGLLVLDEAWTGLDQPARDSLDAAVAERLASGGRVVFVDHEQTRLAGLISERWQLHGGQVTVSAGPDPAGAVPAGAVPAGAVSAAPAPVTVIGLSGADPELRAALARLPGVRSVRAAVGQLEILADPAASDDVLRAALGQPGVRIRAVREEDGGEAR